MAFYGAGTAVAAYLFGQTVPLAQYYRRVPTKIRAEIHCKGSLPQAGVRSLMAVGGGGTGGR